MKACKIDGGVRSASGAPSLLYQNLKDYYSGDELKATRDYERLINHPTTVRDVNGEPQFEVYTGNDRLDNLLTALKRSGVAISSTKAYMDENELRTSSRISVRGMASIAKATINYVRGRTDILAEEAMHMATALIQDRPMFSRALSLLDDTKEFKQYYSQYMDAYKDDRLARKEVLDKVLADRLLKKDTKNLGSRLTRTLKSIWNSITSIFSDPGLEHLIDKILEDIESRSSYDFTGVEQADMYNLSEEEVEGKDLSKFVPIVEAMVDKKLARLEKLESKNERTGSLKYEIKEAQMDLQNSRNTLASVNQINLAQNKVRENTDRLRNILKQDKINSGEAATVLLKLQDDFKLYSWMFDEMLKIKIDDSRIQQEIYDAIGNLKKFELEYQSAREILAKNIALPTAHLNSEKYDSLDSEELHTLVTEAHIISTTDRWIQSLADAKDEFLKIFDQIVKRVHDLVQKNSITEINKMFSLWNNVENKSNLDRFFQTVKVDGKEVLGRFLKGEVNTEQFNLDMQAELSRVRAIFSISDDYKTRKKQMSPYTSEGQDLAESIDEFDILNRQGQKITYRSLLISSDYSVVEANERAIKLIKEAYGKGLAPWFEQNTQNSPEAPALIIAKFKQMATDVLIADAKKYLSPILETFIEEATRNNNFSTPTALIREALDEIIDTNDLPDGIRRDIISLTHSFDAWLSNRSIYTQKKGIIYKFDLSVPANHYQNKDWEKDMSEQDLKFLAYLKEIKKAKNTRMSGNLGQDDLVPQMNKGTQERIEDGDLKGLFQTIHESFKVNSDDTDLGQLDENGNQVKEIPTFFQAKLDYNDMSRDLPTVFANFIIMANHNIEMNKGLATFKLMQDQAASRRTYELVGGKKAYVESTYNDERLQDFVDMVVYKRSKKAETWMGKNTIRIMDKLQQYVSLNGLGFNIFSGVANIFTSAATLLQERAVSKWGNGLDPSSWKKARDTYAKYGLGSMTEYEQEATTNKFKIMSRQMGILDEMESSIGNNDQGKSRLGRIIKTLPFVPNSVGEHVIQHYGALAMMAEVKLEKDGKQVDLIDAMFDSISEEGTLSFTGYTRDGKPFTLADAHRVGRQVNRENQRLFGIYNSIDKSAIQQYALGRFVMQFRKFIVPGFNRRWQEMEFDYQTGRQVEGMYRSYYNFLKGAYEASRQQKKSLLSTTTQEWKRWRSEEPERFNNLIRSHVELANIIAAVSFGALLTALIDAEDEDEDFLAFVAYQMNRHYTEMSFFVNPMSMLEIVKSPVAAVSQLETVMRLLTSFDPFGYTFEGDPFLREYKDGTGDTVFGRNAFKLIPFAKMATKIADPQEQFDLTK